SLEYAVTEITRDKTGIVLAGVVLIAALIGGAYGLFRLIARNQTKSASPFQAMKTTQLTAQGTARAAALSPHAKYVAYVLRDGVPEPLRVRQVAASSDLQGVAPAETHFIGLSF